MRDVRAFIDFGDRDALWKISVAPAEALALLNKLHAVADMDAFLDWGGGLIWAQVSGWTMVAPASYAGRWAPRVATLP